MSALCLHSLVTIYRNIILSDKWR